VAAGTDALDSMILTADVQYQQATVFYVQAVVQRHQDTVALFVALGGGWWTAPSKTADRTTP
jgi:outer membrane protein TolC